VDFREQFGANVRRLRERAGLSQKDLMRVSGVHRVQIGKYERGERIPQAEVLAKLSRGLGVGVEEFLSGIRWEQEPPRFVIATRFRETKSIRPISWAGLPSSPSPSSHTPDAPVLMPCCGLGSSITKVSTGLII
jgi:transcriptional regulator with XRE-family HTH domain